MLSSEVRARVRVRVKPRFFARFVPRFLFSLDLIPNWRSGK
jgi:hypothetical protein|tara:strand:+ start:103 stop:225 length:123 start_codon:yes stop_codon:yes gene_type:complete